MTDEITLAVGGTLADDLAAFKAVWERSERGEHVAPDRIVSFASWEAMAGILTGERYRVLRHLHATPEASVSALARALGRHLRRVQGDVQALERAGLVDRSGGTVRVIADRLKADIAL